MAKLPYFKWYPKDFESDELVRLMHLDEVGLFVLCLNYSWVNEGLPADPEEIRRAMKLSTAQFDRAWKRVSPCFQHTENGRIFNRRQESERALAQSKSEKATSSVRTRYERSTLASRQEIVAPRAYAHDSDSGSKEVKASKKETPEVIPVDFEFQSWVERQYQRHPKKRHKTLAEQALASRFGTATDEERAVFEEIHIAWCATPDWRKNHGQFVPPLGEWLGDDGHKQFPPDGFEYSNAGIR